MKKVRNDDRENVGDVEATELERVENAGDFAETVQELNQNMTEEMADQVRNGTGKSVDKSPERKNTRRSQDVEWQKVTLREPR